MRKFILYLASLGMGFAIISVAGFPVLVMLMAALWYWTLYRGRLTVRAWLYIMAIGQGQSPMEANSRAFSLGYFEASRFAPMATSFIREYYGGRQLKLIAEARARGFVG